jgi:hypothetical protein
MKRAIATLNRLMADPIFLRTCMFLWSLPFIALGVYCIYELRPSAPFEWFAFTLFLSLGAAGLWLAWRAVRGTHAQAEKASEFISDGAELPGVILVLLVALLALPISVLLRWLISHHRGEPGS